MKRTLSTVLLTLLLLTLCLPACPAEQTDDPAMISGLSMSMEENDSRLSSYGYVQIKSAKVNLRSEPTAKKNNRICLLDNYAFALVMGSVTNDEGTWYHIIQAGIDGYILGDYFHVLTLDELPGFLQSRQYLNDAKNNTASSTAPLQIQPVEVYNKTVWQNSALIARAEETESETFTSGDYTYILLDDGTAKISRYWGTDESCILPDHLDGHPVSSIGEYSFSFCSNLTSIIISDTVISIEDLAFLGCFSLTSVYIPDKVVQLGCNPFEGCKNLSQITVSPDHTAFSVIDGVLYSKQDKRLICYPEGKRESTYQIPFGVRIIGEFAFVDCSNLSSIVIPNSVISIGKSAFSGCSNLTSVAIPDSITSIEDWAFSNCSSLPSIVIPSSVTTIGNSAFSHCSSLTFVSIPDSVVQIGCNPFEGCGKLSHVTVAPSHSVLITNDGVLISKQDKRLICFPEGKQESIYRIPFGIQTIGEKAFSSCSVLSYVEIPNTATSIGESAFSNCFNLNYVSIPDSITSIGSSAFSRCSNLTSVTIPDVVTSIGEDLFSYCTSLISVTLPDGIASIGDRAFFWCSSLTSIAIPDSVTSIGRSAFANCPILILIVGRNSYALQYCKENNLNYTYPDNLDWLND